MQYYDYDLVNDEVASYFFKTSHNIFYVVEFKPTGYIFGDEYAWSQNCFEFSIKLSEKSPQNPPSDSLISPTIAEIFQHFCQGKEKVILYMCDTSDRRHLARFRKFDRWFKQFNIHETFIKIDRTFFDEKFNITYYNSLIIKDNNFYQDEIIEAFDELISGIEEDK
ncbi:MAG: DUF6169 family protein [Arcicella sp.]|nr:DUF6169 family protein [Arcicella sp.]